MAPFCVVVASGSMVGSVCWGRVMIRVRSSRSGVLIGKRSAAAVRAAAAPLTSKGVMAGPMPLPRCLAL